MKADRDEATARAAIDGQHGPERTALRIKHWRSEDRLDDLTRQIHLTEQAMTMARAIETERKDLAQTYRQYEKRPGTRSVMEIRSRHDCLSRDEARLRRVIKQLVELSVPPSWTPSTLKQFEDDAETLNEADQEGWPAIESWLVSSRLTWVH